MRQNMNKVPARYVSDTGRPEWQLRAACGGILTGSSFTYEDDRAIFPFPNDPATVSQKFVEKFCHKCPVSRDCLQYAVENGYTGVWGGQVLDDADIRRLRKLNVFEVASA